MRLHRTIGAAALALGVTVAGGGVLHAQTPPTTAPTDTTPASTTPPPVAASSSSITLPLLGSALVVDVTKDAGGGLLDVTVGGATLTPTAVRPGKVAFANEDGSVTVKVSTKRGGEKVSVRAGALGDISGPGGWSGDVFESGETTTVGFTVGATADGGPDITGVTVDSPLEFTIGEVRYGTGHGDHHGSGKHGDDKDDSVSWASVSIDFSRNGQTRSLSISAAADTTGDRGASLRVALGRVHGAELADGPAVGPHTWTGMLCDGTQASISYTVTDTGDVTDVVATPAAEVSTGDDHDDHDGGRTKVRFATGESVSISVRDEDGTLTVGTRERIRCDRTVPTVNGEDIGPIGDQGGNRGDHRHDHEHRNGDQQGGQQDQQGGTRGDRRGGGDD